MRKKLLGWLLLLPLALAAYGVFQYDRNSETWQNIQQVDNEIAVIQNVLQSNPTATITLDDKQTIPAQQYLADLQTAAVHNHSHYWLSKSHFYLSLSTILVGSIAFLLGLFAIVLCQYSARHARRSRDTLLKTFSRCRKALPFILSAQTTLIGICILSMMAYEIIWLVSDTEMSAGLAKLLIIAGISMLLIAKYIVKGLLTLRQSFAMFDPDPLTMQGQAMSRQEAPALWQ